MNAAAEQRPVLVGGAQAPNGEHDVAARSRLRGGSVASVPGSGSPAGAEGYATRWLLSHFMDGINARSRSHPNF